MSIGMKLRKKCKHHRRVAKSLDMLAVDILNLDQ